MTQLARRFRAPVAAALVSGLLGAGLGVLAAAAGTEATAPDDQAAAPQQPAAGQEAGRGGQGRRAGGGGGGNRIGAPIPFTDQTGFKTIFDGKTLTGWDGDPRFWRVENGAIVGESTAEKVVNPNTFVIWRGGAPGDFELKLEFRIHGGNTGVQYRSVEMPDVAKWVLKGYQADIDFTNRYTGMLYEERGRTIIAERGTLGYGQPAQPAPPPPGYGPVGALEDGKALQAHIKQSDWNQFHVIARGSVLIHILNGRVMAAFVDDDVANRSMKGLIGLQLHSGPPMKVEFRNIWLKTL